MNLLRPRNLALLFAAYFGVIGYYAVQAARRASSGAYSAGISITIYQTTMVGGVLVLVGIFITASISPRGRWRSACPECAHGAPRYSSPKGRKPRASCSGSSTT